MPGDEDATPPAGGIPEVEAAAADGTVTEAAITELQDLRRTGSARTLAAALDELGAVAEEAPREVRPYSAELLALLADTRSLPTGTTVAGHAMAVVAAVAEADPAVVTADLDLLLTRVLDGGPLATVYGCLALARADGLDETGTEVVGEVLRTVLSEADDPAVAVAAATAVTALPCEYPHGGDVDPHVQFRAGDLDRLLLEHDDRTARQLYEVFVTAAIQNPATFDHASTARSVIEFLHRRHSMDVDLPTDLYRLAQARLG